MCNDWGKGVVRNSVKYWGEKPRVLECGALDVNGSAQDDVSALAGEYISTDMREGKGVDIVLDAGDILEHFGEASFDVVLTTEMMEHVCNWDTVIYNMVRVLKPGGLLALTTRSPGFGKHGYPYDFWRFTQDDMKKIFEPVGEILELEDDNSGFPGVGIIFRKSEKKITDKRYANWLGQLESMPLFSIDFEPITVKQLPEMEKAVPTIALVMIVKNEEKILERCVESVKAVVDEFVIVDTGSTDGTKEIIKKYGELKEIPFTNFVDTKNKALAMAKSTYILFMDADEIFLTGLEYLKEYAAERRDWIVYGNIVEGGDDAHPDNSYLRARFWRNNGKLCFVGPGVHEVLAGEGFVQRDYRINVKHDHSHRKPESYRERSISYIQIIDKYLARNPNDTRALFYMARTYKDLPDNLSAIMYYKKYLELNSGFKDERWQAAHDSACCWKAEGEYDKALEMCEMAIGIDPRRAETYVLKGLIYYGLQDYEKAVVWFKKASQTPVPDDVLLFLNPKAHFEVPMDYLVLSYDKLKQYRKAQEACKALYDRLPRQDQRITNNLSWLNKQTPKTIFFALGVTPEEVYGGMIERQGVGGVETTYIELPTALVARGHTCLVFCKCKEEHVHKGVYYIPFDRIESYRSWNPDVIITSRWYDPLYWFPNVKKIAWMQDAHYADPNHADAWQIIDAFVCSSVWHRQYSAERIGEGLSAKKINVIPLSIRGELFENQRIERNLKNVIYSSNPDRGLYILQDMWNEITDKVKDIHLTITYGWEGLSTWSGDPAWLQKIGSDKNRIESWVKSAGNIDLTGRLKKDDLAKKFLASSLCLYPNNFWETFCLTGLESQAAGVPMITTKMGALVTTLSNTSNILIDDNPFGKSYKEEFIKNTVRLMTKQKEREVMSVNCLQFFKKQLTWDGVAEKWEEVIYKL